jgi:hypothetical protein
MRKSTLFISAALTTFMLAVLFGVATAYQSIVKSSDIAAQPTTDVAMVSQPMAVVPPTQFVPAQITPEAAADVASKVLGRTDLYSVEVIQFEGADAYLVTFSSGDLVYLSLDGQILSISKLPVTTTVVARKHRSDNGGDTGTGGGDDGDDDGDDDGGSDD